MQLALLVTAVYLVLLHLLPLLGVQFEGRETLFYALRLVAGILLMLHVRGTRQRQWGLVLAGFFWASTALVFFLGEGWYELAQLFFAISAVAGVLLLLTAKRYAGLQLAYRVFGVYLLLGAAVFFLSLQFEGLPYVFHVLGIATGLLLVLRR